MFDPSGMALEKKELSYYQSDWFFQTITGNLSDAVLILDTKMQIVYANSGVETLLGYAAYDVIGKPLDLLIPENIIQFQPKDMLNFNPGDHMGENRVMQGVHRNGQLIFLDIFITRHQWQNQAFIVCVMRSADGANNANKKLAEREQRFRGIVESQTVLVIRIDNHDRFTFANQAYCQMFGKTAQELIGSIVIPAVFPGDIQLISKALEILERPPHRTTIELQTMTANGLRWIDWEISLVQDENDNIYEIQGVGHDITERKKAEEIAIIEKNTAIILAQKSTLAEALPLCLDLALQVSDMDSGGIYLTDRMTGNLLLKDHKGLSETFIALTGNVAKGTPRHQLATKGIPIYQTYTAIKESKNQAALDEGVRSFAAIPIHFNGEVISCLNIASHSNDDIPEIRRQALENLAIQMGNMITRFQVQDDLTESQHQLQSMFDLMDFVFIFSEQGNIITVNQMVLKRLGYHPEELSGRHVLDILPGEQRQAAWRNIRDMLAGQFDFCSLELLTKDGSSIPVEMKVARGRWGNQDVLISVSRDITERNTADVLIKQQIKEIEGFFKVTIDLLCIADFQGNFIRVNKAWENTLGYSGEEILQKKFLEFIHPDDLQGTLAEISNLGKGEKTMNFVNRYGAKDGSWHYLEWRAQSQDNLIYAAARDITERKVAEDMRMRQTELLAYRNQFEEILTSVSTRFINLASSEINTQMGQVLKLIGNFEQVDRSYIYQFDEHLEYMNITHEWCAPGVDPQIDNILNLPTNTFPWIMNKLEKMEEVYIPVVSQLPHEAQSERDILQAQSIQSVLMVPMVINNKLTGFLGFDSITRQRSWTADSILLFKMVGDILSNAIMRKQMESDLHLSEARNLALIGAIPDLILHVRNDGYVIEFKANSAEMLVVPPDKVVGTWLADILDESANSQARLCIEQALLTGQVQSMEYSLKMGDSTRIFEARFNRIGGEEVIAIIRDVSEQVRLEQMKSDFINRATHELRTPIATMLLMTNLMDGETSPEELNEYWTVLKSELARERMLVENLLSAGRLESDRCQFNFRQMDVQGLLEQSIQHLQPAAKEKEIDLAVDLMPDHPDIQCLVEADEVSMIQVFVNLIGNAIKFTPSGGKVHVRLQVTDSGYKVSIIDTGIGIPSEDLPMLFHRFFRGTNAIENEIQGTGIGLFIVRSILDKHGGKIQVTSELGKGSQFDVWLPAEKE